MWIYSICQCDAIVMTICLFSLLYNVCMIHVQWFSVCSNSLSILFSAKLISIEGIKWEKAVNNANNTQKGHFLCIVQTHIHINIKYGYTKPNLARMDEFTNEQSFDDEQDEYEAYKARIIKENGKRRWSNMWIKKLITCVTRQPPLQ